MRPNQPRWKGYPIHAKCGPACRALQSQARGCHKGAPSKEGLKRLNNLKEMKRKDFSTYAKMIKLMINEGDSSRNPESRQLANKMLVDYDKFSVMKLAKGCWLFDEYQYAGYKFTQTAMTPKAAKKSFTICVKTLMSLPFTRAAASYLQ